MSTLNMSTERELPLRSNHCCCCFATGNLYNTSLTYYHNGEPEIYANMIAECFLLEFALQTDSNTQHKICDVCIKRLREAFVFRNLVEVTQKCFAREVTLDICLEPMIKLEDDNDFHSDGLHSIEESYENDTDAFLIPVQKEKRTIRKRSKSSLKISLSGGLKTASRKKNDTKKSSQKSSVKNESNIENSIFNSTSCEDKVSKKTAFEKPYKIDDNDLTCTICKETFPWRLTLERHMSVHFQNHICHICARSFLKKSSLAKHIKRHKGNYELHTCKVCNKTYKGIQNLQNHARYHNRDSVYKCPKCPVKFSSYYQRLKHLIDAHGDEARKYKCKLCAKRYYQACSLTRHVRAVHLQERRFECAQCSSAFFDKSGLIDHMAKHTGVKNFQCDICNKSYVRRFTLKEHMKIHNNIKNFVCTICSKAFTQKCTLKCHMKTHGKEKCEVKSEKY